MSDQPSAPGEERVHAIAQVTDSLGWMIGRNRATGLVFIAMSDGGRVDFPAESAAFIAAALQEYETDESTRGHVADEWGPAW